MESRYCFVIYVLRLHSSSCCHGRHQYPETGLQHLPLPHGVGGSHNGTLAQWEAWSLRLSQQELRCDPRSASEYLAAGHLMASS